MTSAQCSVRDGDNAPPRTSFLSVHPDAARVCTDSTVEDLDVLVALKQQCDE